MIEVVACLLAGLFLLIKPVIVPYILIVYIFTVGLSAQMVLDGFKFTVGSINIFIPDLLYAVAVYYFFAFLAGFLKRHRFLENISKETDSAIFFTILFLLFFLGKFVHGFFDGMPFDSLIRQFMLDSQMVYFFMPFVVFKNYKQLEKLLRFSVLLALIFPFCQPFLLFSKESQFILHAQGTFRLGYGDTNVLLAIGAIALLCWEYKIYMTFIPLLGIMMLAHRSGYIAIVLSILSMSYLKGKKLKTIMIFGVSGLLVIGALAGLQQIMNVNVLDKNLNRMGETFAATGTTKARIGVIDTAMEEFIDRPLTGFSYRENYDLTVKSKYDVKAFNITHPHNFAISYLMNAGGVGIFLIALLLYKPLKISARLSRFDGFKNTGAFLFSSILFFIVYSLMNTTMGSYGFVLWFLSGTTFMLFDKANANANQGISATFKRPAIGINANPKQPVLLG